MEELAQVVGAVFTAIGILAIVAFATVGMWVVMRYVHKFFRKE